MNITQSDVKILPQEGGLEGIYKQIELAGRTCYKSEDKITEGSAKLFVDKMIGCKHYAMLEHGTVYLDIRPDDDYSESLVSFFMNNKYSRCVRVSNNAFGYLITTNFRVIIENDLHAAMRYLCDPKELHAKRITATITTNIGVTREGNRHRVNSIAEESTRYCNYTKDKFGKSITLCPDSELKQEIAEHCKSFKKALDMAQFVNYCAEIEDDADYCWKAFDFYLFSTLAAEYSYWNLIRLGWTPQKARGVLPLDTKTAVVYTAFEDDWAHWFNLRYFGLTGKPHPAIYEVAEKFKKELVDSNQWSSIADYALEEATKLGFDTNKLKQ